MRTNPRSTAPTPPTSPVAPIPNRMGATVRAMGVGQHLITVLLAGIGMVRAVNDGAPFLPVVIAAGVFLGWYFAGQSLPLPRGRRVGHAAWLLVLLGCWLACAWLSVEFVWLAFPLWLLAGQCLPPRWAATFSLAVYGVVAARPLIEFGSTSYAYLIGPLVGGIFAYGISYGYLQLLRDAEERQRLVASLLEAQEDAAALQEELAHAQRESGQIEERTRLSREIHDTIAQGFSSIVLLAQAAGDPASRTEPATALRQIETISRDNLVEVRRIVAALAPAALEAGALTGAVQRMLDRLSDETGVRTELHADASLPALPTTVEVALLRTAQSALANVRRHSGAQHVVVSLVDAGDSVRLDIVDDGSGFDPADWAREPAALAAGGYGLLSMRARLRELGGGLDVETAPGDGTALSAHLPLGASPSERPGS